MTHRDRIISEIAADGFIHDTQRASRMLTKLIATAFEDADRGLTAEQAADIEDQIIAINDTLYLARLDYLLKTGADTAHDEVREYFDNADHFATLSKVTELHNKAIAIENGLSGEERNSFNNRRKEIAKLDDESALSALVDLIAEGENNG